MMLNDRELIDLLTEERTRISYVDSEEEGNPIVYILYKHERKLVLVEKDTGYGKVVTVWERDR